MLHTMHKRLRAALANGLLLLAPFALVEGIFQALPVSSPPAIQPVHAGTAPAHVAPHVRYRWSRDWNFSVVAERHSNNYGFIHRRDYERGAAPLMAVVGDSFVEANGIAEGKAVAELLDASVLGSGHVYSFAISGAALPDYLAYAQYARETFRPAAMAFVIIGNDFDESLLKYKHEPRFHYFTDDGRTVCVDYDVSDVKELLRHSATLRYVMHNLEAGPRLAELLHGTRFPGPGDALERRIADSQGAVDRFFEELPAKSGLAAKDVVFVLDAARPNIYDPGTRAANADGYHNRMRRYFAAKARALGYELIDLEPVFLRHYAADGSRFELAPTDSHWNAAGHRLAADEIRRSSAFRRLFRAAPGV